MSIKENTEALAKILEKEITFNADKQQLETTKEAIDKAIEHFGANGLNVTRKQLDDAAKARRQFIAATGLATGNVAIDTMAKKANKDIKALSATWNFAKGEDIEHTVVREFEARIPPREKGGEASIVVKKGRLETTLNIQGSKTKSGELKAIRDAIGTPAEEKL